MPGGPSTIPAADSAAVRGARAAAAPAGAEYARDQGQHGAPETRDDDRPDHPGEDHGATGPLAAHDARDYGHLMLLSLIEANLMQMAVARASGTKGVADGRAWTPTLRRALTSSAPLT